ncbi:MAG: alpha/beta hydrolase [Planctomycetota bacterium]
MRLGPPGDYLLPLPDGVEHVPDVPIGRGGTQTLHAEIVRLRVRPAAPSPVVIWLHGGGWAEGNRRRMFERVFHLAAAGYVCVAAEYRLSGVAPFPAQLLDVQCVIRWIRAHATELGVDPLRVGLWGASAGAHLAALSALRPDRGYDGDEYEEPHTYVQAVVDFFGPTDLLTAGEFEGGVVSRFEHRSANSFEGRLLGGDLKEYFPAAHKASPLNWVGPGAPPFLIMHGAKDDVVPVSQSRRLHEKLLAAGVDSTLVVIPEGTHGTAEWEPVSLSAPKAFFDRVLKG